jgi:hypothetical protein
MPRNMSFALTTKQFRERTKTVTRRKGWEFLKVGDVLNGCVKCMGLKTGEKIERLGQIRVVDVQRTKLNDMADCPTNSEAIAEGFPDMTNQEFVDMFCDEMGGSPTQVVTRIEFKYLEFEHLGDR